MKARTHSNEIKAALSGGDSNFSWIQTGLDELPVKGDHRHRIPAQLFDLSIDHGSSIQQLIALNQFSSAFALMRCQFECFVRGAWLFHCASDEEIEIFVKKDRIDGTLGSLIEKLETKPPFDCKILSHIKNGSMKAMHGYTHGGLHQVSRRINGEYIESSFEDAELSEVIRLTTVLALIAFAQIATIAEREDLAHAAETLITKELFDDGEHVNEDTASQS